ISQPSTLKGSASGTEFDVIMFSGEEAAPQEAQEEIEMVIVSGVTESPAEGPPAEGPSHIFEVFYVILDKLAGQQKPSVSSSVPQPAQPPRTVTSSFVMLMPPSQGACRSAVTRVPVEIHNVGKTKDTYVLSLNLFHNKTFQTTLEPNQKKTYTFSLLPNFVGNVALKATITSDKGLTQTKSTVLSAKNCFSFATKIEPLAVCACDTAKTKIYIFNTGMINDTYDLKLVKPHEGTLATIQVPANHVRYLEFNVTVPCGSEEDGNLSRTYELAVQTASARTHVGQIANTTLTITARDVCDHNLFNRAQEARNLSLCDKIVARNMRYDCRDAVFYLIAVESHDSSVCDSIRDGALRERCIEDAGQREEEPQPPIEQPPAPPEECSCSACPEQGSEQEPCECSACPELPAPEPVRCITVSPDAVFMTLEQCSNMVVDFTLHNCGEVRDEFVVDFAGTASQWVLAEPQSIVLGPGETSHIYLAFRLPVDADLKEYTLLGAVVGRETGASTSFTVTLGAEPYSDVPDAR
ncbi:hypothetical protein COY95_03245, partial [Candidatus Woesearchaeota archaeon CG_4_10_14_0_8_um_filter_47_5]